MRADVKCIKYYKIVRKNVTKSITFQLTFIELLLTVQIYINKQNHL